MLIPPSKKLKVEKKKCLVIEDDLPLPIEQPTILFPKPLYTGKQVITVMLKYLCQESKITLTGKT